MLIGKFIGSQPLSMKAAHMQFLLFFIDLTRPWFLSSTTTGLVAQGGLHKSNRRG